MIQALNMNNIDHTSQLISVINGTTAKAVYDIRTCPTFCFEGAINRRWQILTLLETKGITYKPVKEIPLDIDGQSLIFFDQPKDLEALRGLFSDIKDATKLELNAQEIS